MRVRPDFELHRDTLLSRLGPDEGVLLFGAAHRLRNGDTEFKYRPASDLWWLTGWPDPDVALLVRHGEHPFTLFVQPKNPEMEVWTGIRPGPEGAVHEYGMDAAHDIEELPDKLIDLLQGLTTLHYAWAEDAENDALLATAIKKSLRKSRKSRAAVPMTFHHPAVLLHELRLHKNPKEIRVLREAARITGLAHAAAMRAARPGTGEWEIEAVVDGTFRREGGDGPGYSTIVASGPNACILHHVKNDRVMREGDLLLLDAGGEVAYYTADVTRTFPVSGTFSPAQRRLYDIVLAAQIAAIEEARVGRPYRAMHDAAVRVLVVGLIEVGLLQGNVDEIIADESYKRYYMHGTGHWLGLDVHDVGLYQQGGESRPLQPGMVVTVEPGLYIPPDDLTVPADYAGIGIRIEDDVLITEAGPEVLTASIPKHAADVEAMCRREA
jgi:Xaa-Pro aminopeptidase